MYVCLSFSVSQAVGKLKYPVNDFPDALRDTLVQGIERLVTMNPSIEMQEEKSSGSMEAKDKSKKKRNRTARYIELRKEKSKLWREMHKKKKENRAALVGGMESSSAVLLT